MMHSNLHEGCRTVVALQAVGHKPSRPLRNGMVPHSTNSGFPGSTMKTECENKESSMLSLVFSRAKILQTGRIQVEARRLWKSC